VVIINFFINKIKLKTLKKKWRSKNKHNYTYISKIFNIDLVEIGKGTYGEINLISYGGGYEKLIIGNYCSIAKGVTFLLGGEHDFKKLSTFPFRIMYLNEKPNNPSKGEIVIGDDVWIGYGAFFLSGVKVGNGAVIGAKTVVSKDIPPYAIVVGNPMKIIKYRFPEGIIKRLQEYKIYENLTAEDILNNIDVFDEHVNEEQLNKLYSILKRNQIDINKVCN